MPELNKAALEGIGAARHASVLFDAESGVETGGGAGEWAGGAGAGDFGAGAGDFGAGAGVGDFGAGAADFGGAVAAAGVDAVMGAAGAVLELPEELAPQPLSAAIKNKSVS